MAFVHTWDSPFEASPPDQGENASLGAQRIRELKAAIRERLELDHSWEGDANDGKHKWVTLINQASDPTISTGQSAVFTKTVGGSPSLYFKPQGGDTQLLGFDAGTRMLFQQSSAPTGWTKSSTHDNKALRVVSGSASSGGSSTFTSMFASSRATSSSAPGTNSAGEHSHGGSTASHTLTVAQIPSHTHEYQKYVAFATGSGYALGNYGSAASTGATGGGEGHSHGISTSGAHSHTVNSHGHTLSMNVAYVDVIIAQKD